LHQTLKEKNALKLSFASLLCIACTLILTSLLLTMSALSYAQSTSAEQADNNSVEPNDQSGEFRWISDDLFIYLRAGPSADYRLLGSVTAGTKIQLLQIDSETDYAEIIDDRQRTGWVETKFVSRTQSIRTDIEDLQASLDERDERLSKLQLAYNTVNKNVKQFDAQKAKLNRQITQQLEDIARLNELLEGRERASNLAWFTRGAILGVIALLIGYILGLTGRKRKSNNRLM
jgi:SH3 domain protein